MVHGDRGAAVAHRKPSQAFLAAALHVERPWPARTPALPLIVLGMVAGVRES
jgi:hypothetical protein